MFKSFKRQYSVPKGFRGMVAGRIMALENKKLNSWTISTLGIHPHDHILEVGFGTGHTMKMIVKKNPTITINGIDVSETMKEQADKRLTTEIGNNRVKLFVNDIEEAKLKRESYDRIFSVNNYTIWDHPIKGLENLFEGLKHGGTIAITMQPREENGSSIKTRMFAKQIHDDMTNCGFSDIRINYKEITPELAVCVTAIKPK